MGRKFVVVIVALLLCISVAVLSVSIITAQAGQSKSGVDALAKDLRPNDDKYVDYAKDVKYDTELHPDLKKMGMFWISFGNDGTLIETPVDSEEAASIVDPEKPTIILVHGMMADGHYTREMYYIKGYPLNYEDFGINLASAEDRPRDHLNMAYLWIKAGWNVAFYHYEMFASEGINFWDIEQKIWQWVSREEKNGLETRYLKANAEYVYNPSPYSMGEHFAAEYIRAMNRLPKSFGDKEIRIAAHSMGGQVVAAGLFLLTELSRPKIGQLDERLLPNRYALMDTFFSAFIPESKETFVNLSAIAVANHNVRWSKKPLINNNTGDTIARIMQIFKLKNIALEYYTEPMSFLNLGITSDIRKIRDDNSAMIIMNPDWKAFHTGFGNPHNGVREWYLTSILTPLPKLDGGGSAISAATPTEDIFKQYGKCFIQTAGEKNIYTRDDVFKIDKYY